MLHPALIYEGEYGIRTYEIDAQKRLTVVSLIKLMQEAAMQNVIELGLSVWDLAPLGLSWVVTRMDIELPSKEGLPLLGERLRIRTHGAGFERLFTYRDYRVWDERGAPIALASSAWLLMNLNSRRLARIPDEILAYETPPADQCLPRPALKLPAWEGQAERSLPFTVHWHDLDFNGHLNNLYYIQWMLETLDDELLRSGKLRRLQIQFAAECKWHDRLSAQTRALGVGSFMHRLLLLGDTDQEVARAITYWE